MQSGHREQDKSSFCHGLSRIATDSVVLPVNGFGNFLVCFGFLILNFALHRSCRIRVHPRESVANCCGLRSEQQNVLVSSQWTRCLCGENMLHPFATFALHAVGRITAWEAGLLETEQLLVLRSCGQSSLPSSGTNVSLSPFVSLRLRGRNSLLPFATYAPFRGKSFFGYSIFKSFVPSWQNFFSSFLWLIF